MTIEIPIWLIIAVYLTIALFVLMLDQSQASGCYGWVAPVVQALLWPLMILVVVWFIVDVIRTGVLQAVEDWRRMRKGVAIIARRRTNPRQPDENKTT